MSISSLSIFLLIVAFVAIILLVIVLIRLISEKKKQTSQLEIQNAEIDRQVAEKEACEAEITNIQQKIQELNQEIKETQVQLLEAEKMASLGKLVAGVAHEINTPIGIGVTASSALIESTKEIADKFKLGSMSKNDLVSYLDNMYTSGKLILKNMDRAAAQVQSFKQVGVDQQSEQEREFQVYAYIQDILFSLKPEIGKFNIKIAVECDANYTIHSYPGLFAQVFINLVMNSLTHAFTPEVEGQISIKAAMDQTDLFIEYEDNGRGISEADMSKIFDPFFTSDKEKGTGLGLNIVYTIITEKLKGKILCESQISEFTRFIIRIPLNK